MVFGYNGFWFNGFCVFKKKKLWKSLMKCMTMSAWLTLQYPWFGTHCMDFKHDIVLWIILLAPPHLKISCYIVWSDLGPFLTSDTNPSFFQISRLLTATHCTVRKINSTRIYWKNVKLLSSTSAPSRRQAL